MPAPLSIPAAVAASLLAATLASRSPMTQDPRTGTAIQDPFLWLEDVDSDRALGWVRAQNARAEQALTTTARFRALEARLLSILDSTARIPYVQQHDEHCYNFWQDATHPRGVWRRTTWSEYVRDEPRWEVLLDLDALGQQDQTNWVWKGAEIRKPDHGRALVSLSRGGADAAVTREFDLASKTFVDGGFVLPEAKGGASWRDADSVFVGTDFGPGSLTASGYPRVVKLWRRGTPLEAAEVVFEGRNEDVAVSASRDHTKGFERDVVTRATSFFRSEQFLLQGDRLLRLDKQDSANATLHREWLLLELREDWTVDDRTFRAGSLLAAKLDAFLHGQRAFDVLFEPTERSSLSGFAPTRSHLLLNVLDNVRNRVFVLTWRNGSWQRQPLPGLPEFGTVQASAVDADTSDDYFLVVTDYLTPTSLWRGTAGGGAPARIKSLPAFFRTEGLAVEQREAKSKDGTRVPYFLVGPQDLRLDGKNPTLLYGYGGFEVALTPTYSAGVGSSWLEQGGVFVVANIRGGGEFGPRWHQAALKQHRNRAFEDFAAVAEDLIARKITSPRHLGIQGGSNGGLLMGNMLTTYPQLFGAIVIQVPLLDMLRYHRLLAGASWIEEYGDPEQSEHAVWLRRYSAYHNIERDAKYPPVLFTTSTRDDRVHPAHARKAMARLLEHGHDALYYENIEGGHGGAADNKQAAHMLALAYSFLWQRLR